MRRLNCYLVVFIILSIFLFACTEKSEPTDTDQHADDDQTADDDAGVDDDQADDDHSDDDAMGDLPQWLLDRPYLQNRSLWQQDIDMAHPPWPRKLGCLGIGNGKVFGILADEYPLTTWHNLGGPTYQKDFKWFSDKQSWVLVREGNVEPTRQSVSRVRNAPIALITATNGVLEWTTVNFAPQYTDNPLAEETLISVWIFRNLGETIYNEVTLNIDSNLGVVQGNLLHEPDYDGDYLTVRPLGFESGRGQSYNDLWIKVGRLAPGDEVVVPVLYLFTNGDQGADEIYAAVETASIDTLLESTVEWWNEWAGRIIDFQTSDPKFDDLLNGLALAVKVNQAVSGAASAMSQYSYTWLRDTYGPALFYPFMGLVGDFKNMLDYLWGVTLINGNLGNALPVNTDLSDLPPQPDWENLPVMGGRQRAEGPSFVPLEYEAYYRMTGDIAPLAERYGMMKHALVHQDFVDNCLLYFSTDETFEDLMEAAFGLNILEESTEDDFSANSSYLMIRAAHFMAELAERLDYPEDVLLFNQMADDVRNCLEAHYWLEDKGYYAIALKADTRQPWSAPYEDVSTQPIWLKALPMDDPHVVRNFETVMRILGHPDGTLYSHMAFPYGLIFSHIQKGALTGMSHAFWLMNLARMFHPVADTAFERWADIFSASGNLDEAQVVDDWGHLAVLTEPYGAVCDISARFRSWEAGIFGHALLYYLTGYEPNVPDGEVYLAPHLPPGWPSTYFGDLPYGPGSFALGVKDNGWGTRTIIIKTDAQAAFTLQLAIPIDGPVRSVAVNDIDLAPGQFEAEVNAYGRTVVRLGALNLPANSSFSILIKVSK